MRFSVSAFLMFVAFFVLLTMALSSGSTTVHIAEAVVTVIIAIGLGGYALRDGQRRESRRQ
jgi:hypothetical protein